MTDFAMSDMNLDPAAVEAALAERADQLRAMLGDLIKQNLSGDVLATRSGALLNSIETNLEDDGSQIIVTAASRGVPYAAILEYGGKTAAHDIVAVKAGALAFTAGGTQHFAKTVHHPGSTFKAYAYLGGALEGLADEIRSGLKTAVLQALGAS